LLPTKPCYDKKSGQSIGNI